MGYDLLARATVDVDGELVAHGAGRQEDRGLLVQQLRRHLAEAVHTGIVAALLVADRCLGHRSEEHTSELQSLMRISYAVFCLKKKITNKNKYQTHIHLQKVLKQ